MIVHLEPLPGQSLPEHPGTVVWQAPRHPGSSNRCLDPADLRPGLERARWCGPWDSVDVFVRRCRQLSIEPWIEVHTTSQLRRAAQLDAYLWLCGSECAGDSTGSLTLIGLAATGQRPWVVQGLRAPSRAATICLGAAGVVCDTQLWSLPDAPVSPSQWSKLAEATCQDSVLVGPNRVLRSTQGAPAHPDWADMPGTQIPVTTAIGEWWTNLEAGLEAERSRVQALRRLLDQPLPSSPLPTPTAVVQGPMANVSEGLGLARAVLSAGALPSCALGALDPEQAASVLGDFAQLDGPWVAGLIGFDGLPQREAHIALLQTYRPSVVLISGGSISLAKRLIDQGHTVWLHTPSPRLSEQAARAGVHGVILEGRGAGGHVGQLPSLPLWTATMDALQELSQPPLVILAGGIGTPETAAMAQTIAASYPNLSVAYQVGTAFFGTHEIIESQQLTSACQQALLACEDTTCVGVSTGMPLRCAPNAFTDQAQQLERQWLEEGLPKGERRHRLERLNIGRTRMAAKGIERGPTGTGQRYVPVAPTRIRREGAFTMGETAALQTHLQSVQELLDALTIGAQRCLHTPPSTVGPQWAAPVTLSIPRSPPSVAPHREVARSPHAPIAIVGLGCVLPGAHDVRSLWEQLFFGMDALRPVPTERWDASRYYRAGGRSHSHLKSRLAGVVNDPPFDSRRFRIPPRTLRTLDRSQRFALLAAEQACAGLPPLADNTRGAVMLGNAMGGEAAKDLSVRIRFREVLAALDELHETGTSDRDDLIRALEADLDQRLATPGPDSLAGTLGNLIAARVASWLDWMGGAFTVDAACAASLSALDLAIQWLRQGRVDRVLTGGVDTDLSPETHAGFGWNRALSPTRIRPFSTAADGFTMGEGAAVFALQRLDDALDQGVPIWAVIHGVGQSSDGQGRGITAPRPQGQRLALQRALHGTDIDLADIGLIEGHGTGTPLGDSTEVQVLADHLGPRMRPVWLGSIKGQIGHLKSAAGAAGLLKTVLATATGVCPPSLGAASPLPLPPSLSVPKSAGTWKGRYAGVSAFGFGGANVHAILERPPADHGPDLSGWPTAQEPPAPWTSDALPVVLCFGEQTHEGLLQRVLTELSDAPEEMACCEHRLVLVTTPDRRTDDLQRAHRWLSQQTKGGVLGSWLTYWVGATPKIGWVCPGQGSQQASLWRTLSQCRATHGILAAYPQPPAGQTPGALHRTLFPLAHASVHLLRTASIPCDGVTGHSLGEYGALLAAECGGADAIWSVVQARGDALDATPEGAMVALRPEHRELARQAGLTLAANNGHQSQVWGGTAAQVNACLTQCDGIQLSVERAFHTPAMAHAQRPLADAMPQLSAPKTPLWMGHTGEQTTSPVHDLVQGLVAPVRFQDAVRSMVDAGIQWFIELAPGRALTRHVLTDHPTCISVPLCPSGQPIDLIHSAARLAAAGHPGLLRELPGVWAELAPPRSGRSSAAITEVSRTSDRPTARPASPSSFTGLVADVAELVAEVSGYPLSELTADDDLEATLGVDSIQKLEIVGLIHERLGVQFTEADQAELMNASIDDLVRVIQYRQRHTFTPTTTELFTTVPYWLPAHAPQGTSHPLPSPGLHKPGNRLVWRTIAEDPIHAVLTELLPHGHSPAVLVCPAGPGGAALVAFGRIWAAERKEPCLVIQLEENADPVLAAATIWLSDLDAGPLKVSHVLRRLQALPGAVRPAGPEPEGPVLAIGSTSGIVGACVSTLPGPTVWTSRRSMEHPCDLTDSTAVSALAGNVAKPTCILHGAAVLHDGPVHSRTPDQWAAVWAPKVQALRHLQQAFPSTSITAFSSAAAHGVSPGQSLYAAANAWMEAELRPMDCALAWTAWEHIGLTASPAIRGSLGLLGVQTIPPAMGAAYFRAHQHAGVSVVTADPTHPRSLPAPFEAMTGDGWLQVRLDPASPALGDHRVQGRPLVPAALWLSLIHRAVNMLTGQPCRLVDFCIMGPTFVDSARNDVFLRLQQDAVTITAGGVVRVTCLIRPADPLGSLPHTPSPGSPFAYPPSPLFHGPHWHVLDTVSHGSSHVWGTTSPVQEAGCTEAVHQLLALWSIHTHGCGGLPVSAGQWQLDLQQPRALHLHVDVSVQGDQIIGHAHGWDEDGVLRLTGNDIRLTQVPL